MTLASADLFIDRRRLLAIDHSHLSIDLHGSGTLVLDRHRAVVLLEHGVPVALDVDAFADADAALAAAENATGRWVEGDSRWRRDRTRRTRQLRLSRVQPDVRLLFQEDGVHHAAAWLLAVDRGANGEWVAWTHEEWRSTGDVPGAWSRGPDGFWRMDGESTPSGASGVLSVEEFVAAAHA